MKRILVLGSIVIAFTFAACGAENDAKDVCNCYKEVIELNDADADEKMNECLDLLSKYLQTHEEAGTLDEFNKAYNLCR